jgi:hypothetical protein
VIKSTNTANREQKQSNPQELQKHKGGEKTTKTHKHYNTNKQQQQGNMETEAAKPTNETTTKHIPHHHLEKQSLGLHCHSYRRQGDLATRPTNHFQA